MNSRLNTLAVLLLITLFSALAAQAQTDFVSGDATAIRITDSNLEGYWKYCMTIRWDVSDYPAGSHSQSHVTIELGLDECIGYCGDACFVFPDTVGVSDGWGGCEVYYYAELDLGGDPQSGSTSPTLKFEPYYSDCEPDIMGTATVCFYSMFPPRVTDSQPGALWIKFGTFVEEGMITGMLPGCRTASSESSSWSLIKRLFR